MKQTPISFDKLKSIIMESQMSQFEVGMKYEGWTSKRYSSIPNLIVVEIAPDRSYLLGLYEGCSNHAFKFKIIDDDRFGEKIKTHPQAYTYEVWRSDKVIGPAEIPSDWVSDERERRKAGAAQATKTKSANAWLKKVAENMNIDFFLKVYKAIYKPDDEAIWNKLVDKIKNNNPYFEISRPTKHNGESSINVNLCWKTEDDRIHSIFLWIYADHATIFDDMKLTDEEFQEFFKDI